VSLQASGKQTTRAQQVAAARVAAGKRLPRVPDGARFFFSRPERNTGGGVDPVVKWVGHAIKQSASSAVTQAAASAVASRLGTEQVYTLFSNANFFFF